MFARLGRASSWPRQDGICFDIELTKGAEDLVKEFEKAYAACRKAGMLVMITTSHSAPCELLRSGPPPACLRIPTSPLWRYRCGLDQPRQAAVCGFVGQEPRH